MRSGRQQAGCSLCPKPNVSQLLSLEADSTFWSYKRLYAIYWYIRNVRYIIIDNYVALLIFCLSVVLMLVFYHFRFHTLCIIQNAYVKVSYLFSQRYTSFHSAVFKSYFWCCINFSGSVHSDTTVQNGISGVRPLMGKE